jgi:hypothetical protein
MAASGFSFIPNAFLFNALGSAKMSPNSPAAGSQNIVDQLFGWSNQALPIWAFPGSNPLGATGLASFAPFQGQGFGLQPLQFQGGVPLTVPQGQQFTGFGQTFLPGFTQFG